MQAPAVCCHGHQSHLQLMFHWLSPSVGLQDHDKMIFVNFLLYLDVVVLQNHDNVVTKQPDDALAKIVMLSDRHLTAVDHHAL